MGDLLPLIASVNKNNFVTLNSEGKQYTLPSQIVKAELIRVNAINYDDNVVDETEKDRLNNNDNNSDLFATWKTNDANQAFRRACAFNSRHELKALLQQFTIDINRPDDNPRTGYTALHIAIMKNNLDNALFLLEHKARYDIADKSENTAIDYLSDKDIKVLTFILNQIILPSYGTEEVGKAFRMAADRGDTDNLKLLLKLGVNVDVVSPDKGQTALHRAVFRGHYKCVELLLKAGASTQIKDKFNNKMPLQYTQNSSIINLLLSCKKQELSLN